MAGSMTTKPKRKIMRRFALDEISAVDKPAQEGAKVAIMKRKTANPLVQQIIKRFLDAPQLVEPTHARIAKGLSEKESNQSLGNLIALETSLHSIVGDSSLNDTDKLSMMKSSVGEFLEFSKKETPNVDLAKAFGGKAAEVAKSDDDDEPEEGAGKAEKAKASEDEAMNLRQLQKQMNDLTGKLNAVLADRQRATKKNAVATDDDDEDVNLLGKRGGKATKADPPAAMSEEDEAAARLRAIMSGEAEKAEDDEGMEGMFGEDEAEKAGGGGEYTVDMDAEKSDSDEQDDGLVTTEGEEEEPIAAGAGRPIGGGGGGKRQAAAKAGKQVIKRVRLHDDSIVVEGQVFTKAKVGSGLFAVLQQQQQRLTKVEKQANEEREARELLEFAKVAEDELPNLPGTSEQKAGLLKTLAGTLDKGEQQLISRMLRAGDGGVASAFRSVGTSAGGELAKAAGSFEKRITEIRTRDNCKRTEALQKARKEYPDEFAAYQGN